MKDRKDLDSWKGHLANEAEKGIHQNALRPAFQSIQHMHTGWNSNQNKTQHSNHGDKWGTLPHQYGNLNCWKEHFEQALNFAPAPHCPDLEEEAIIADDYVTVSVDPPSLV